MTQNEFLIRYLKSGKSITSLQAHRYGITSLSKRMCEIEKSFYIVRSWKNVKTRYGSGKTRVVEYWMILPKR